MQQGHSDSPARPLVQSLLLSEQATRVPPEQVSQPMAPFRVSSQQAHTGTALETAYQNLPCHPALDSAGNNNFQQTQEFQMVKGSQVQQQNSWSSKQNYTVQPLVPTRSPLQSGTQYSHPEKHGHPRPHAYEQQQPSQRESFQWCAVPRQQYQQYPTASAMSYMSCSAQHMSHMVTSQERQQHQG